MALALPAFIRKISILLRKILVSIFAGQQFINFTMPLLSCDIVKTIISTPIGNISMSGCTDGLHTLHFCHNDGEFISADQRIPVELIDKDGIVPVSVYVALEWLKTYFKKPHLLEELETPNVCTTVKAPAGSFNDCIWSAMLNHVKFGKTISYQQLAALANNPKASRAVGNAMKKNPIALIFPCHRVIMSNGSFGNYAGGNNIKQWLIQYEQCLEL